MWRVRDKVRTKKLQDRITIKNLLEQELVTSIEESDLCIDEVLIDLAQLTKEFGAVRLKMAGNLMLEEVVTEEGTELIVTQLEGMMAN